MTPLRFAITSPHLDVKRTCTSKLSIMHGVQQKPPNRGRRVVSRSEVAIPESCQTSK
jgi:hypothetical protein